MRKWLLAEKTYEGFPLFLRRPADFDVDALRPLFPTLVIVTHKFAKRKPDGLPESGYNHGLAGMDHELVAAFDVDQMGVPSLVETFGGERNYYFYVADDTDVPAVISPIVNRYPGEKVSWSTRPDPQWIFITRYAKEYF
jgi:hypothetical protein